MNGRGISLWGFVGTVVLTGLLAGSQALGLTRMNIPFMLGTMVTPDRDRAKVVGFGMHLVNGWLFAAVYAAAFQSWRRATWWLGALIGLVHAGFVLVFDVDLVGICACRDIVVVILVVILAEIRRHRDGNHIPWLRRTRLLELPQYDMLLALGVE